MANAPGFLWHFGLRMNFRGSDCKGVWHKTTDGELRMSSLQIRTLHRQEFRKSSKLKALLKNWEKWKAIPRLHATVARQVPEQPQANEFANMLEQIFGGSPDEVMATAPLLLENNWHKDDLLMAIKRFKANKSADEKGFVAELLHFASDDFLHRLLGLFNGLMHPPQVPIVKCSQITSCMHVSPANLPL